MEVLGPPKVRLEVKVPGPGIGQGYVEELEILSRRPRKLAGVDYLCRQWLGCWLALVVVAGYRRHWTASGPRMSAETDFWTPATQTALVEFAARFGKASRVGDSASSSTFNRRMQAAVDIEVDLLERTVAEVLSAADLCVHSSDIQNADGVATAALEPIARARQNAVEAQRQLFSARGNGQFLDTVASAMNDQGARAHAAAVQRLRVGLEQRTRKLIQLEGDKSARASERAEDVSARRKKDRIDFYARIAQLAAAAFALLDYKPALLVSMAIGALSIALNHPGKDDRL